MECLNISIKGVVQGVGFRPFVYNLANDLSVKGYITNTSGGVIMTVEGTNLDVFLKRLKDEAPSMSKIMSIDISPAEPAGYEEFTIRESTDTGSFTLLSPDIAVCGDCFDELFHDGNRRYLYPFINCTNCGPRYSITRAVPYDRINTTMDIFEMCEECRAEYLDPSNRRFHAQPNACERCGPHLEFRVAGGNAAPMRGEDPLMAAVRLLNEGHIVAVKGLGGFHIACNAVDPLAVGKLRERKRKNNKPFALMAPDMDTIRRFCHVSSDEERHLLSDKKPIVLLRKREGSVLPDAVASNNRDIGFMLPYTPIHHLLFHHSYSPRYQVLVMTSGNISEEPIVIDNSEAVSKLSGIADAFLLHDRDIFMRIDDSVIRMSSRFLPEGRQSEDSGGNGRWSSVRPAGMTFIRRARGFVPEPIPLHEDGPDILGCGADLKNTFTFTRGRYAVPSQHIGDMENYETLRFFEETLRNLMSVYRVHPKAVAHDLHPGYLSTQWALSGKLQVPCFGVQHHYAHIGSVMAEHGLRGKVIGVAFDGSGFGEDGTLWGGEFLVADIGGFKRAGHVEPVALPGGEAAMREPWRIAVSSLLKAAGDDVHRFIPQGFIEKYGEEMVRNVIRICGKREFSPLSSGAGRIFDAVSALTGVCDRNTYEGEASVALESLVLDDCDEDYPVDISFRDPMEIDFSMTFLSILNDMERGQDIRIIATRFHNTVASSVLSVVLKLSVVSNIRKVAISGGVFQNTYLMGRVLEGLRAEGMETYVNRMVPCNDAGISLGQAYIIRERIREGLICRT